MNCLLLADGHSGRCIQTCRLPDSGESSCTSGVANVARFSFTGHVANPGDILQFFKARAKAESKEEAGMAADAAAGLPLPGTQDDEGETKAMMTALLRDSLQSTGDQMAALTDLRLIGALEEYVWKDRDKAIGGESDLLPLPF